MTEQEFVRKYKKACNRAFREIRKYYVPNPKTRYKTSTGNLAKNALKKEWIGLRFHMWVDEEVAPYMVFTNEEWLSKRWKGKHNPNQNWWNIACQIFINIVELELNA